METQVRTPQMIFMQPQRFVVPLFQRPYVWNQDAQWEPLWSDVTRVADRILSGAGEKHNPHFLGAVVLQQVQKQTGQMQERTIIDGQQRLTTLQLLLDALHTQLIAIAAQQPAMRLEPLTSNAEPFCSKLEDRFKVWPTNRDRAAFNAVMGAKPPIDYNVVGHRGERMVEAHRFFSEQARKWLTDKGGEHVQTRAVAIETAVRDLLQMVVIDLGVDENAQEIFETLNARGTPLTAADLIKNFVFQRLLESRTEVERVYEEHWKEFETGFWETEINVGRIRYPRSSLFLNHWLIARTGKEVVAREVFDEFKRYATDTAGVSMPTLVAQIHRASDVYRDFITRASAQAGPIDRLGLFGYRAGVLESEVVKPLVLCLLDPQEQAIPDQQFTKALDVVESWMVRRMLVRASTKNYNQVFAELIGQLGKSDRLTAGDLIENYLASQSSESRYWPDDAEVREEVGALLVYRRLGRGRLRMVLEAIEDYQRGWRNGEVGLGGERVARTNYAIEHIMPRRWHANWPLNDGADSEADRERTIHLLGNLTLLTGRLNSKVSNGPWMGAGGKREALNAHDVLVLNRELLKAAGDQWNEQAIRARTQQLVEIIIQIWPAPLNHRSGFTRDVLRIRRKVQLSDLISAGALAPGTPLFPRRKKFSHRVGTVLPDGKIDVDGSTYLSPTDAASAIVGKRITGWGFFLVDQASRRSLRNIRREYIANLDVDAEEDLEDDADDDEEE
jgi:hypothetical protein